MQIQSGEFCMGRKWTATESGPAIYNAFSSASFKLFKRGINLREMLALSMRTTNENVSASSSARPSYHVGLLYTPLRSPDLSTEDPLGAARACYQNERSADIQRRYSRGQGGPTTDKMSSKSNSANNKTHLLNIVCQGLI